ncbi:S8 family serine peptidase [Actinomyces glycerinitolerans]|uniref:Peptidase s8 subtilisin asp-active site n=1 Tax=Actinomyces glycerinitolerans TaxID=1892869 RepID=A0A1M4RZG5_9ACTO|nr:S8 family serine peptidase [Actinomyces glycerinitolerans]SHE25332.1 peptidase s8 subtilisin asp-active site [Actinomyces glycerinitolerans]
MIRTGTSGRFTDLRHSHRRRRLGAVLALSSIVAVGLAAGFPAGGMASADETPATVQTDGFVARNTIPRTEKTAEPQPQPTPQAPEEEPVAQETTEPEPTPEATEAVEPTPDPTHTTAPTPTTATEVADCERGQTALVQTPPSVIAQIGAEQAWTVSTGQGVVVAVVDSGVDATNPHLTHALVDGVDLTGTGEATTDVDGLGTAVAGVISGRAVSGSGLTGLAHDAAIMPVRVLTDTSEAAVEAGTGPRADQTASGIVWAADNGATIIVVPRALSEGSAELAAAVEHATAAGALVVASTGDQPQESSAANASAQPTADAIGTAGTEAAEADSTTRYPAAYEGVLGVTALDSAGAVSDAVLHGDDVDLAVPAQSVLTAFFGDGDCVVSQQAPSTALATGYAGAAAALVAEAHGTESPADWAYRLTVTALRTSPAERNANTGWGLVAPYAAIEFVNDGTALGPANPRGSTTRATPAVAMATPPSPDPAPARRRRLAASVGAVGTIALILPLVASKAGGRAPRAAARK